MGINAKMTLWLYKAVIRPLITYAAVVWWPKSNQVTIKKRLDSVQRLACIGTTGAMSTTPTDALNALLDLPSLDSFILGQARICSYRLEQTGGWKNSLRGHSRIKSTLKKEELSMPSDYMVKEHCFMKPFKTSISSREDWNQANWNIKDEDLVWYTDGSKNKKGAGAGIQGINPRKSISISLGTNCTVFQAEICALTMCIRENLNMACYDKTIYIFTDNQALILALKAYHTTSLGI